MKVKIKNEKEFKKLINKNKFQVFLFTTHLFIPLNFAVHSWIVTNNKGKIKRWEIWQNKNLTKSSWGYGYLNLMKPSMGMNKYANKIYPRNKSKIIGLVEGKLAKQIINFLEKNFKIYPLRNNYKYYPGPNSNTFPR